MKTLYNSIKESILDPEADLINRDINILEPLVIDYINDKITTDVLFDKIIKLYGVEKISRGYKHDKNDVLCQRDDRTSFNYIDVLYDNMIFRIVKFDDNDKLLGVLDSRGDTMVSHVSSRPTYLCKRELADNFGDIIRRHKYDSNFGCEISINSNNFK